MSVLYGIRNCDSVRKARRWLEANAIDHRFHDFREQGLDTELLTAWCDKTGWKSLLNTRSRTWQELAPASKSDLDQAGAINLMVKHPTLIRRPVLVHRGSILVGFKEAEYRLLLAPPRPGNG